MSEASGSELFLSSISRHKPLRAVVLGSGMGAAMDHMRCVSSISWAEWPGLGHRAGVSGHSGTVSLRIGDHDWPCLVISGRLHRYEGNGVLKTTQIVRALPQLGIREVVLTCATGGIHPEMEPGTLARVEGLVDMTDSGAWRKWAWESIPAGIEAIQASPLAALLERAAGDCGYRFPATTLAQMIGPTYETKAEVGMLRFLGVGVVGMSSGHEWRAARLAGMDSQILALVTNWACGLRPEKIDHGKVMLESAQNALRLGAILAAN